MARYINIKVENASDTDTIFTYLKANNYSKNYLKNLRKAKTNILLNGEEVFIIAKVKNGDTLELNVSPNTKTSIKPIEQPLDIVFEDDYLLIVNKPSGLSSMPNRSHYDNNLAGMIVAYMQKKDPEFVLRIVNRLDKDTQGLVMISKSAIGYNKLLQNTQKIYHAILDGNLTLPTVVNSPILDFIEGGIVQLKRVISPIGKPAISTFTPIKQYKKHTLCSVQLVHGRTHQIRVHASSIGLPLLGDYIYGNASKLINHTALVCKEMTFVHPWTEKQIKVVVPYERAFESLLKKLGK